MTERSQVVKVKLSIPKKLAHKLGRVKRWEDRSATISLPLRSRYPD